MGAAVAGDALRPLWPETAGEPEPSGTPLRGDANADVAVVGAGFTGLWTAYHLLREDPSLRVVVLERDRVGAGASGRNGGWCSALFATSWPLVANRFGSDAAVALRRQLVRTVDEIGSWCADNAVAADFAKGGALTLARSTAQLDRLRRRYEVERAWVGDDVRCLDAPEALSRVRSEGVLGGLFDPHCATLHPLRLVRGVARAVTAHGGTIHEQTPVHRIEPHAVHCPAGTVRADVVIRATEAYTAGFDGAAHRLLAPLWSLIVATEPVDAATWAELGWAHREAVTDGRHLIVYAQRTADGRVVFGGRGAPYGFGSRTTERPAAMTPTFDRLVVELRRMFPVLRGALVPYRWGGVVGVPRDWFPSVTLDRTRGLGWAGGYVGDGVACSHLAGRTLADLVLGCDSELTRLPWVNHRWRRWEPEPLRWLGIRGMTGLVASADAAEARSGRPARRAELVGRLVGR